MICVAAFKYVPQLHMYSHYSFIIGIVGNQLTVAGSPSILRTFNDMQICYEYNYKQYEYY